MDPMLIEVFRNTTAMPPAPATPSFPCPQARLASEHEALEAANVLDVLGSAPMVDSVVFQMKKLGGMLGEEMVEEVRGGHAGEETGFLVKCEAPP